MINDLLPLFARFCRHFVSHNSCSFVFIRGLAILPASLTLALADGSVLYENNFEKEEQGKPPADMLVVDGKFSVKTDETNKFLDLPGARLDSYSVQFGPAETNGVLVSAR